MFRIFVETFANVIDSSALIIKAEHEKGGYTRSLSDEPGAAGGSIYVPVNGVVERSNDANAMEAGKQGDYVVDVVLPSVFIALLFIGNAIIVYVIFQYRKRKQPAIGGDVAGEEMALRNVTDDFRQV